MRGLGVWVPGLIALVAVILLAVLTLPSPPAKLHFRATGFERLEGWQNAALADTAAAFTRSCRRILKARDDAPMGGDPLFGHIGDWKPLCSDFLALGSPGNDGLRQFFETHFMPLTVTGEKGPEGLFTGYYEPEFPASLQEAPDYTVPLYTRPTDLITVNLGLFSDDLKGKRIAGRVENGTLTPYPDRAAIEKGAVTGKAQPVAWLRNPVDAFFLHIQGSGLLKLPDGSLMRVGYAAQNGRDYTAIGRVLIERGALPKDGVSMQSIRAWLESHPEEAASVMDTNRSYVFFRKVTGEGPIGSEGVPLTAGYSLAVDRSVFPMGLPLWLETTVPGADGASAPMTRLMIAQDTGGAIKGSIRGDVFWGTGDAAGEVAGRMQNAGRYYAFVPKALAGR